MFIKHVRSTISPDSQIRMTAEEWFNAFLSHYEAKEHFSQCRYFTLHLNSVVTYCSNAGLSRHTDPMSNSVIYTLSSMETDDEGMFRKSFCSNIFRLTLDSHT